MKAIVRTLMEEYRRRGSFTSRSDLEGSEQTSNPVSAVRITMALLNRAREEAEGVFYDIQALIGVTDVQSVWSLSFIVTFTNGRDVFFYQADLLACRAWMSRIKQRSDTS